MKRSLLLIPLPLVAVAATFYFAWPRSTTPVAEQFSDRQFDELRAVIRPCDNEDAFDRIAWLTSIHEARIAAAREGKPILLWEMDGHPLGCG